MSRLRSPSPPLAPEKRARITSVDASYLDLLSGDTRRMTASYLYRSVLYELDDLQLKIDIAELDIEKAEASLCLVDTVLSMQISATAVVDVRRRVIGEDAFRELNAILAGACRQMTTMKNASRLRITDLHDTTKTQCEERLVQLCTAMLHYDWPRDAASRRRHWRAEILIHGGGSSEWVRTITHLYACSACSVTRLSLDF